FSGYINNMFTSAMQFYPEDEKQYAYKQIPAFAPLAAADGATNPRRPGFEPAVVFKRRTGVQNLSEQEIMEYMLYDPMILKANAQRGKVIYEKAGCNLCHRFGDTGTEYGPDLTTIGSRFKRKDIIEATIYPSKTISDLYAALEVITKDGKKYIGPLVN